jgi:hypothetical protein
MRGSRPYRVPASQKEMLMTGTPHQPTTALTEDEQKTVRSAALRACALVAQAEPGFLDTFKESFAASKAVKAASPEVQKLVTGGLPEMPSGGTDTNARTLELLKQAVVILTEKAPQLVEEYRQVVVQSAKDVAAAADDTSAKETDAVGEIERALAG